MTTLANPTDTSRPKRPETGGPAFPRPASIDPRQGTLPDGDSLVDEQDGMTLRDWFAGKAMEGFCACPVVYDEQFPFGYGNCIAGHAAASYAIADAMIAARKEIK